MKLRIVRVDMDGYCGRDHHPDRTDEGLVVIPVKMERIHADPETGEETNLAPLRSDIPVLEDEAKLATEGFTDLYMVWTVVTEDGRTLELIEHEVEVVK